MSRFLPSISLALLLTALAPTPLLAADWPQFRGPDRNGIVPQCPPLVDSFPDTGPKKLWESENIPGSSNGGWSSVSIADGKAYVFVNLNSPKKFRMITRDTLNAQGYAPEMPADLSGKVEQARISPERKALKEDKAVNPWVDKWIAANLPKDQSKFKQAVRDRLKKGPAAVSLDLLARLTPIIDQKFDTDADFTKWLDSAGFDQPAQAAVRPLALPPGKDPKDFLYCLDAATGKTLWTTPFDADWFGFPASSTPTIVDAKVYVLGSAGAICCFDAHSGNLLWQGPPIGKNTNHHARASSILIHDGLAIATTEAGSFAVSLETRQVAWSVSAIASETASPVLWTSTGKTSLLLLGGNLQLTDPKDGTKIASTKGGRFNMPTVVGDYVALPGPEGLTLCKLSPDKIEALWTTAYAPDEHACPVIDGNYVYAIGGGYNDKPERKGKAACLDLQTGKILWEQSLPMAQLASPILADGKIFAIVGSELLMYKASPEKFQPLGRADLGLEKYCSPSLANGKLFLRTPTKITCYDLAKP